jgi:hypothetical protein
LKDVDNPTDGAIKRKFNPFAICYSKTNKKHGFVPNKQHGAGAEHLVSIQTYYLRITRIASAIERTKQSFKSLFFSLAKFDSILILQTG